MAFSIRLTAEEELLARRYAALTGVSMGEAFKQALFEKIENEYDIAVGETAYRKYLENPKTYSHSEVLKMFGDEE
ncbi:DUF6290 family protein [Methanomassiliicoccales archaeon LGM-RCC1]|nr:DUF6290 family protein [Methanomassiliicoccales archaeon LGM-RCC1]